MALAEDAAAVLEQFIHDVANLPAEVAHLYEEAQAKQDSIASHYAIIASRDSALQKFIKMNGSLVINPKEDEYAHTIKKNFQKVQELQDEKLALVQKSSVLLDRYVKRLDVKLRDLQNEGAMPIDHSMPSLLRESPGNLVIPSSSVTSGVNTPLQPLSLNTAGGPSNPANAALNQVRAAIHGASSSSNVSHGMPPNPMLNRSHLANAPSVAALTLNRSQREMSASSDRKRARPEGSLNMPPRPSNLARQSSLGPGTPKAGTPSGSRAGSVGPGRGPAKRPMAGKRPDMKSLSRRKTNKHGLSKKINRRIAGLSRASPSTTGEDSVPSEDGSDAEGDHDHEMDSADADDDGADDTKYCYCQRVSYGDMVACDNAECKNQWFHWECAELDAEPVGEWLCRDCAKLPRSKIKKA